MKSPVRIRYQSQPVIKSALVSLALFLTVPIFPVEASNLEPPGDGSESPAAVITFAPSPAADLIEDAQADLFYASFRNHSWDIPDELFKTSDLWIGVDLTQQMLYVYRGSQLVTGFVISSGVRAFRTVTGIYKIYAKYPAIDMRGPGYDLADVPYSMFFHKGYAIHGTYWHNNFGRPMSRGCVNMVTEESAWLYENAPVGTYVIVYY